MATRNKNRDQINAEHGYNNGGDFNYNKLYVTNLPKGLNEDGLMCLFSKHGTVDAVFLSQDPSKRFAIITYANPTEASFAIMKLNRTEPLKLNVAMAHKKSNQRTGPRQKISAQASYARSYDGHSDDINGHSNYSESGEHYDMTENAQIDEYDEEMTLEDLQLQQLKLQEAQIKIKMSLLLSGDKRTTHKPNGNRCILADGTVVVRNDGRRSADGGDAFSSAEWDSRVPALRRVPSRACAVCGAATDQFCARCGVAPYCGVRCQTADWASRHRSVCHNLARVNKPSAEVKPVESELTTIPTQPLRQPHSNRPAPGRGPVRDQRADEAVTEQKNFERRGARDHQAQNNWRKKRFNQRQNVRSSAGNANAEEEGRFEPRVKKDPESVKPVAEPAVVKSEVVEPADEISPTVKPTEGRRDAACDSIENSTSSNNKLVEIKAPGSVKAVTPERRVTPKMYLPETLATGEVLLLSVESPATTKRPGLVCVALHDSSSDKYELLCSRFGEECEADTNVHVPTPGETFAYLNPDDGGWYRARCLKPKEAALIDSGHVVLINAANCRKLSSKYEDIVEFSCQLDAEEIEVGDSVSCELVDRVGDMYKVRLNKEGRDVGVGVVFRWMPEVQMTAAAPVIPEVTRPAVQPGCVLLVDGGAEQAYVRPADAAAGRDYDAILHDVLLYGLTATPLKEPPQKGDVVVGKFTDGNHYRALCKRTNVKQNKYLLEYVEYGNIEKTCLEDIYPCPDEFNLVSRPTVVSMVKLQLKTKTLSPPAVEYLEKLRDDCVVLTLRLPDGSASAPSGSEVVLTVAKTKESVNKKLEALSTPEWKKLEKDGGDVLASESIMFSQVQYLELPTTDGELDVLDVSMLANGAISGYSAGHPNKNRIFNELSEQMRDYCTSAVGRAPYLPRAEEMCIVQCPDTELWMRAVLCEQVGGAGGAAARVCLVDVGDLRVVPAAGLRKMMPEFMRIPVLTSLLDLRGFPKYPSEEQLARAKSYMKINTEGRGTLKYKKCVRVEPGVYEVDAPELLRAVGV